MCRIIFAAAALASLALSSQPTVADYYHRVSLVCGHQHGPRRALGLPIPISRTMLSDRARRQSRFLQSEPVLCGQPSRTQALSETPRSPAVAASQDMFAFGAKRTIRPHPRLLRSTRATIYRASLPRGRTGRRGYAGGSLNRNSLNRWTRPHEIAISRHSSCRTSAWRQNSVPTSRAIARRQLPRREILSSSSSSLEISSCYFPRAWRTRLIAPAPRKLGIEVE